MLAWRGCGGGARDPNAAWGGMSKEEWLKTRKERDEAAAKEEEASKRMNEAKKKEQEEAERAARDEEKARQAVEPRSQVRSPGLTQGAADTKSPEIASLPRDPANWKDADFLNARLAADPRLLAALEYRAERFPHEEPQAVFLRNLLAPKEPAETKDPAAAPTKAGAARALSLPVLAVIAKALAENPTSAARQAIADVLAGAFGLENDQVAVQVTLKALADHPSEENDSALLAAVTQPDKIRPAGQGQVTAEALQKLAFGVLEQDGKSGIRVRLAKRLAEPACPQDLRRIVKPMLEQKRPDNLEAQAILFQSMGMQPKTEAPIEKQLLDYSHEALVRVFFGLTGDRSADGEDPAGLLPAGDPDWADRVMRLAWSDGMAAVLSARQVAMTSLDQDPNTILFAATIPTTEARSRLARTLARHREEGPNALKSAGWTKTLLCSDRRNRRSSGGAGPLPANGSTASRQGARNSSPPRRSLAGDPSADRRGAPVPFR